MSAAEHDDAGLGCAVTPHGKLRTESAAAPEDGVGGAAAARLRRAFESGSGHGLLHLGAAEVETPLPPGWTWFREVARLFLARLCAAPDLEELRERIEVPPPTVELAALAAAAPPLTGAEYLDADVLGGLWNEMLAAFREEIREVPGPVQEWLRQKNPVWNLVGRVHLHLAERKDDAERPFAFLATFTTRVGPGARVQHRPLGQAVQESARARDKGALLSLLAPVHRAAEKSPLLRQLVDDSSIFHPLAWNSAEAYRFLQEVPAFEAAGLVVRIPDWWRTRRAARPQVSVTIGSAKPGGLGLDALLDFSVRVSLDGEDLSRAEWEELLAGADGLVRLRGHWVEVDREKLKEVLGHWRKVERAAGKDGVTFIEGMRLLAGAPPDRGADDGGAVADVPKWSEVHAGPWLAEALAGLRDQASLAAAKPGPEFRATLRPYQETGVAWLRFLARLGLGACLADDMGLGKTVQVLALLSVLKREPRRGASCLVAPASLVANWQAEIARFAPGLKTLIAHASAMAAEDLARAGAAAQGADLVITTYGTTLRLPWLAEAAWDVVILDEAQAIKNPGAKQTRAVKSLKARARIVLTGTPIENRLSDLWSLFDFLNPGLLGSAAEFGRFVKRIQKGEPPDFSPLRNLVRPYILRRLKTDRKVIQDLPDKSEVKAWCHLTKNQAALYQQSVEALKEQMRGLDGIRRRGLVLAFLMRLKQICNHPSQWLGDEGWEPAASGKFARLAEICEPIAARQEKALVFTQFRETTAPLASFLAGLFGRPGLVLHGETPVRQRQGLVDRFQQDDAVPFFVLSVKAGGTGLNLTAASHVIHFDRWWNPAVEDQATDRAFRIGQRRNVLVQKFVCRGTVEERIDAMIEGKKGLSRDVLDHGGEKLLTEMDDRELLDFVALDVRRATAESL